MNTATLAGATVVDARYLRRCDVDDSDAATHVFDDGALELLLRNKTEAMGLRCIDAAGLWAMLTDT